MVSETLEFYTKALGAMSSLGIARASQKLQSIPHHFTYQATPNPKNVVIIGGSYAGTRLAQRLTETLPTGYRAVLIERNSHFNHFFVFPRFSVVKGKEEKAFIPYDNLAKSAPAGIFEHIRDTATEITPNTVKLSSGVEVEYEYLTVATGSWQPAPSKYDVLTKTEGVNAFRATQRAVEAARTIAVVGGGPVGVQIATDIKSYYPAKEVTLVHSRDKVLSAFGPRLQGVVMDALRKMGVGMVMGERPAIKKDAPDGAGAGMVGPGSLTFKDGTQKSYDLVVSMRLTPCYIRQTDMYSSPAPASGPTRASSPSSHQEQSTRKRGRFSCTQRFKSMMSLNPVPIKRSPPLSGFSPSAMSLKQAARASPVPLARRLRLSPPISCA